jgi:FMN phosphatase YigB (HAD superfamily)
MLTPKAIFFDLNGTLIDTEVLHPQYTAAMAAICAERFGGEPEAWAAANREVVRRWDELAAGLDFCGREGVRHRGVFDERAWRMQFELLGRPLPALDFVDFELAHEYEFTRRSNALFPDTRDALERLAEAGFDLHAISDAGSGHIRGCLEGGGVAQLFSGFHGYDDLHLGLKQPDYFRRAFGRAGVGAAQVLVVEDNAECVLFAHEVGAAAVMIRRQGRVQPKPEAAEAIARAEDVAVAVLPSLTPLPELGCLKRPPDVADPPASRPA